MTVAFYMNCVSAHQIPLAREVAALVGHENFVYVDNEEAAQKLQTLDHVEGLRIVTKSQGGRNLAADADLVLTGLRDLDLLEARARAAKATYYYSERWFKPIEIRIGKFGGLGLPGWVRLVVPRYRRMLKRFVAWTKNDPKARVLAVGPWAKKDFLRMGVPAEKIVPWGYFVAPSAFPKSARRQPASRNPLRVLWAGRRIPLKHVDDIEKAVSLANSRLASEGLRVELTLLSNVTPAEVRQAMRELDTFVFASNGYEGWGAVVSEALEEGMNVLGTWECGAPPTLLPKERLFHCGDVRALARLLEQEAQGKLPPCTIGEWTAKAAAERLMGKMS